MTKTARALAGLVAGELEGDAETQVSGVSGLSDAQPGHLSFYANPKYKKALQETRASVVLVGPGTPAASGGRTFIRVPNPHLAFARIAAEFHPPKRHSAGISSGAHVDGEAAVDGTATIMAGAFVSAGATVGARDRKSVV